jgi:hypothetical protein
LGIKTAIVGYVAFLITSEVLYVRRRGATTEAYGVIRRKEEQSKATQPFGFAQGHELVEWQMMPRWWIRAPFNPFHDYPDYGIKSLAGYFNTGIH